MSYYQCTIRPLGYAKDQTARKKVFDVVTKLWRDRQHNGVRIDYHQAQKNFNSQEDPQEFLIEVPKSKSLEDVTQFLQQHFPKDWLRGLEIDDESIVAEDDVAEDDEGGEFA
jgi:hypothetical protein